MDRPPFTKEKRLQQARMYGIIVDPEDEWLLEALTWNVHHTGYVYSYIYPERIMVFLHHYIIGFPFWEGDEVDHDDNNKLNNRRNNLAIKTIYENRQNRDVVREATNVYRRPSGSWVVKIHRNGEQYYETFGTMNEAVAGRDEWLNSH